VCGAIISAHVETPYTDAPLPASLPIQASGQLAFEEVRQDGFIEICICNLILIVCD
jgi:hypothetical protein